MISDSEQKWYVIMTRPRYEKIVYEQIARKRVEIYLPLVERFSKWCDRVKRLESPLIPGYVFIHSDETGRKYAINGVKGALRYLFYLGRPAVVTQKEIDVIKLSLTQPERVSVSEIKIQEGDLITITRGNFKGLSGYVTEFRGNYKLTINLNELSYALNIELELSDVEALTV